MKNVTYYSAGAGSGKTYTLTHLLADKIKGGIAPSELILTTFTKAAAKDFRERARAALYEAGMHDKAALLDQALIGTVHSVGEAFIRRYWYLLGLSPDMKVMDEDSTNIYISQSLAQLPKTEDIKMFREFQQAFNLTKFENGINSPDTMFWKSWLNSIISMGASYRVKDFNHSLDYSLEQISKYFQPKESESNLSREKYQPILQTVLDIDENDKSKAAQDRCETARKYMKAKTWSFAEYFEMGKFLGKLPKKHTKLNPEIPNAAAELGSVWQSPEVYKLMESLVRRLFELAEQWREEYVAYKKEMRIIDFNDMEVYMLQLLQNPAIADEIKGRYKCLMVDEFQDSSPIQVDIFNRLSELVSESYWCGDSKQAIYGFRGADTELTEAVANMIPAEKFHTLDTSYRSEPDVVNFCNSVFSRAFANKLEESKIVLKPHREKTSVGPNLIHWASTVSNKWDFHRHIAEFVSDFYEKNANNPADPFTYSDIAILARTRSGSDSEINQIAAALSAKGIPVNVGAGSLLMQKETELVIAVLTLLTDPANQLAKAKIAYLTTPELNLSELIDSRLEALQDDDARHTWLDSIPLIQRILSSRKEWLDQSVSALIESVVVELNLRAVLKSWSGSWKKRENNLYQIIELAVKYEDNCQVMTLGATATGFLDYLQKCEAVSAGDNDGVVVCTYHQAKGLQWKNVILVSLDHKFDDDKEIVSRNIFGVQKVRTAVPTADNLFPEMIISLIPQVFPSSYGQPTIPDFIANAAINSPEFASVKKTAIEECKRLLYVGMTRAKDKLITTAKAIGRRVQNPFSWFESIGIKNIPACQNDTEVDLCDTGLWAQLVQIDLPEQTESEDEHPTLFDLPVHDKGNHKPKFIAPSNTGRNDIGEATLAATNEERIPFRGTNDEIMAQVGDCIHNTYAACTGNEQRDIALAEEIIKGFHFEQVLPDPSAIIRARQFLVNFLAKFGKKTAEYHELPFHHQVGQQIVRGFIDLVWETTEGSILIDYKTYPGKISDVIDPQHKHYAGLFKPQFDCYRQALEAAGHKVLASFVFYPVNGTIVEIK